MHTFTYSRAGLALTESFEGVRLTAYQDVRGVWTIGYGHTGPEVHPGLVCTQAQADAWLLADVKHAADTVNRLVTIPDLTQDEFDALVDFAFNCGCGAFTGSTLLKDSTRIRSPRRLRSLRCGMRREARWWQDYCHGGWRRRGCSTLRKNG